MTRPIVRLIRERVQTQAPWIAIALALIAMGWLAILFSLRASPYSEVHEVLLLMRGLSAWGAVLLMLVTIAWWHGDASALSQRLPSWLMTRPIRTATLAGVEYLVRLAVLFGVTVAAATVLTPSPALDPIPVGHVMVTAAVLVSAGWLFGGLGRGTATACSAIYVFGALYLLFPFALHLARSASVDPGPLYCAVPIIGCGLLAALGVWLDRHGVWSELRGLGFSSAPAAALPVASTPPAEARSPFAAQVRAEFREWAWVLPATATVTFCLAMAYLAAIFIRARYHGFLDFAIGLTDELDARLIVAPYLAAAIAGLLRLPYLARNRGTAGRTFFLSLPQSDLDLGNARLAAGGLAVASVLALHLFALSLSRLMLVPFAGWAPLFDLPDLDLLAQMAVGVWALYWLIPLAIAAFCVTFAATALALAIPAVASMSDADLPWIITGVYLTIALLVITLACRRLLPPRRQLAITIAAVAIALLLTTPEWMDLGIGADAVPFVLMLATAPALPFLTVPATAHWLRHR